MVLAMIIFSSPLKYINASSTTVFTSIYGNCVDIINGFKWRKIWCWLQMWDLLSCHKFHCFCLHQSKIVSCLSAIALIALAFVCNFPLAISHCVWLSQYFVETMGFSWWGSQVYCLFFNLTLCLGYAWHKHAFVRTQRISYHCNLGSLKFSWLLPWVHWVQWQMKTFWFDNQPFIILCL